MLAEIGADTKFQQPPPQQQQQQQQVCASCTSLWHMAHKPLIDHNKCANGGGQGQRQAPTHSYQSNGRGGSSKAHDLISVVISSRTCLLLLHPGRAAHKLCVWYIQPFCLLSTAMDGAPVLFCLRSCFPRTACQPCLFMLRKSLQELANAKIYANFFTHK